MKAAPVLAVLWAGSLAAAWFLAGAEGKEGGAPETGEVDRLKARVAELERAAVPPDRPTLAAAPRPDPAPAPAPQVRPAAPAPTVAPGDGPAVGFSLEGVSTADEASRRLMAYVAARLAEGEKGHLELFKTLDRDIVKNKQLEALLGSEEEAARHVYPWVKFLVGHDEQIVAMTETVYRTMAEDPAFFAEADHDTLEVFTEGLGVVLPGAASEETMGRLRAHARRILDTAAESQPEAIRANRRRIERLMPAWAPLLTSAEAAERLRRGDVLPAEALAYLRRLTPEDLRTVDVVAILGPLVEAGDPTVRRILPALALDDRTLSTLDQRYIDSAAQKNAWWVGAYLEATGRREWVRARPFVEAGLRKGGATADAFATALATLAERPPADYVRAVVEGYALSEATQASLRSRFGLR